ncbi:hypothetical protein H4R24_003775 [Coemansia sp. RSA 988]|nr:hypothetical protein H4R24_003775 [Coemansia sp. RSA 988]
MTTFTISILAAVVAVAASSCVYSGSAYSAALPSYVRNASHVPVSGKYTVASIATSSSLASAYANTDKIIYITEDVFEETEESPEVEPFVVTTD